MRVFHRHFLGIDSDFVGVVDSRIHRQTPGLMSEDTLTLLTSRLRMVSVAVIRDWIVVEHGFSSQPDTQDVSCMQRQEPYQTQPHLQCIGSPNRALRKIDLQTAHDLIHISFPQDSCENRSVLAFPGL
jgi:hypothetical protein